MHSDINSQVGISVIFGGMSPEHSASVKSFENVYEELVRDQLPLESIFFIDQGGQVLSNKFDPQKLASFYKTSESTTNIVGALSSLSPESFLLNLLHGRLGEDGCIQGLAQITGIKMSSEGVLPAALTTSKHHMNSFVHAVECDLRVPETIFVTKELLGKWENQIKDKPGWDNVVIKPNSLGASLMTERHAKDSAQRNGNAHIRKILEFDRAALVQQFVKGMEYSIGVIQTGDCEIALPVVKIETDTGFFGHAEKHRQGMARETIVNNESDLHLELKEISIRLFRELGCADMCRFDFIVGEEKIFFLEANYIPGLMKNSIFPKMIEALGMSISELVLTFKSNSFQRQKKQTTINYEID